MRRRYNRRLSRNTGGAPTSIKHGFNISGSTYYDGGGLFINRLYDSAPNGPTTTDGYPTGTIGASVDYLICSENQDKYSRYKAGTYKAKGVGTGARITFSGLGLTPTSIDTADGVPFTLSITLPAWPVFTGDDLRRRPGNIYLKVTVANITGGTIPSFNATTRKLGIIHADDEADYDGGVYHYTRDFRNSATTASKGPVRPMALMQTVSGWVATSSDIPSDSSVGANNFFITYPGVTYDPTLKFRIPSPEKLARLAIESGNPLWVSLWVMLDDAGLKTFFDRLAAAYTSGELYVEGGNEVWNVAYTANSGYLATQYGKASAQNTGVVWPGAGVDKGSVANQAAMLALAASVGDYCERADLGGAYYYLKALPATTAANWAASSLYYCMQYNAMHFSLRCFKAAEAPSAFNGRTRVRRTYNCQLTFPDNSFNGLDAIVPAGFDGAGQAFGKCLDACATAAYFAFTPDDLNLPHGSGFGNTGRGIVGIDQWNSGMPRRDLLEHRVWENNGFTGGNGAAWMERAHKNGIDDAANYVRIYQTRLALAGYAPMRYIYEGNQSHDDAPTLGYLDYTATGGPTAACYLFSMSAAGAFTLADGMPPGQGATIDGVHTYTDSSKTLANLFSDGDLVQVGWNGGGRDWGAVANAAGMTALASAAVGDYCRRTDLSGQLYTLNTLPASSAGNWSASPSPLSLTVNVTNPCRIIGGALYLFPNNDNGVAYASGLAANAIKAPGSGSPSGKLMLANVSRLVAYHSANMDQMWANVNYDGTGVTVMDYWHNKMVTAGISISCNFTLCGGATNAFGDYTGNKPWAYKPNGYAEADTAQLDWIQAKT